MNTENEKALQAIRHSVRDSRESPLASASARAFFIRPDRPTKAGPTAAFPANYVDDASI